MDAYLETAFGVMKLLPGVVELSKDIWKQLKPPQRMMSEQPQDGIKGNTYYSADCRFSISVPDEQWEFWRPSAAFLASMGPRYILPSVAIPIMIFSKQMIKLFRPNASVIVEKVGQYTNIDEMIHISVILSKAAGCEIRDEDIHIDNSHQSGVTVITQPYIQDTLYQVQQYFLNDGLLYTITASYVPASSYSKQMFGGLQEIVNSFQIITNL